MKNILKTIYYITLAFILSSGFAFAAINIVPNGGTGVGTISGIIKGNGTSPFTVASAGTDYQAPITLTTTGSSGSATFISNTLNIPNYVGGVSSVSNSDGTLTVSPTTGAVVESLALGHANTWTALQTHQLTTEQLRLGYDATHYNSFIVDSAGNLNINPQGTATINVNSPSTSNNQLIGSFLQLSMPANIGGTLGGGFSVGAQNSTGNSGVFQFLFAGNNNTLNAFGFGIYGYNDQLAVGISSVTIGQTPISANGKLNVWGTTEQLRLNYNLNNYASFTVASNGTLAIAQTGTNAGFIETPSGTGISIFNSNSGNTATLEANNNSGNTAVAVGSFFAPNVGVGGVGNGVNLFLGISSASQQGAVFEYVNQGSVTANHLNIGMIGFSGPLNVYTNNVAIGQNITTSLFSIAGGYIAGAWGTTGVNLSVPAATFNDSSSTTGTIANNMVNAFGAPTLNATNTGIIYTNAATMYIAGAPIAGTHVTLTSPYALDIASGDSLFGGNIFSNGGGGMGYTTGAGGTVTQTTSKSTGVTINKYSGTITMNNAALSSATIVSFTVTDSDMGANDVVVMQHDSGGTLGVYTVDPSTSTAGSFVVNVRNDGTLPLSEAIVLRFAIIKGSIN